MWTPPTNAIPHHGVEDRKQLPHARHQRHLLRLAHRKQPPVELLEDGVVAGGDQRPMYKAALTGALPPHTSRLPRSVPESRLKGATPTKAERRLWVVLPSSGSSASRVLASTGPTPGTLLSSACFSPAPCTPSYMRWELTWMSVTRFHAHSFLMRP